MPVFPFTRPTTWTPAQQSQWYDTAFRTPSGLLGIPANGSILIIASPHGGKTVAVNSFVTLIQKENQTHTNPYNLENVLYVSPNAAIFQGIMQKVLDYIEAQLNADPSHWQTFDLHRLEAWRVLFNYYCGEEDPERFEQILNSHKERLPASLKQIKETEVPKIVINFCRYHEVLRALRMVLSGIGSPHLTIICDDSTNDEASLREFFQGYERVHIAQEMTIILSVDRALFYKLELPDRLMSRFRIADLEWSKEDILWIAERHLWLAFPKQPLKLEYLFPEATRNHLLEDVVTIFGSVPRAGIALAEIIYDVLQPRPRIPATSEESDEMRLELYRRHVPLRYDNHTHTPFHGGRALETFTEAQQGVFDLLWRLKGEPADFNHRDLQKFAGSSANRFTIIRRIREIIEPIPDKPIYLKNKRNEGYWLEHFEK